jgi:hypothetical protein
MAKEKWIAKAINPEHKGSLRKSLKVKEGKDIPKAKLEKAAHSKNPETRRQANLAKTLRSFHKGK